VERPRRVVRLARLIHRPRRVLGGPSARAAFGGSLGLPWSLRRVGAVSLYNWLFHNQLVDEITLLTYPLILGQGTRLFPDTGPDTALDLVDSRATPSGVIIQVYRPTGRPQYATATAD
jgi:hypothetical protein